MFDTLKRIFKRKNVDLQVVEAMDITFQDMSTQDICVKIVPDGHDSLLHITEQSNKFDIVLDDEKSLILSAILAEYGKTKNLSNIIKILNEEEN